MAAVVIIDDGCSLNFEALHINKPNENKLSLHCIQAINFTLIVLLKSCTQATRQNVLVIKVGI